MSDPIPNDVSQGPAASEVPTAGSPASATGEAPPAPQPPASTSAAPSAPAPASPSAPPNKLSTFLKVSIILLAALSIASIALVFVGDFEGKVERITATFLIFAVFVTLTALDTSRGQRNGWYAPVALIANSYILALMLIVTWMSDGGYFLGWNIFWKSVIVIAVTRAVVGCCQLLIGMGEGQPEALGRFAFITSVLAVISGILFTAPLAIEVFDVEVPELYWKFAVAALLLTALGLAITLLLRWSYSASDRDEARRQRQAAMAAAQLVQPTHPAPEASPASAPLGQPGQPGHPGQPPQPNAEGLLPWPTFADGRPLPAGPDGQPDFSVPGAPRPPSV